MFLGRLYLNEISKIKYEGIPIDPLDTVENFPL